MIKNRNAGRPGQQLSFLDEPHDLRAMMTRPLPPSDLPEPTRRNGKWVGRRFDPAGDPELRGVVRMSGLITT